MKSQFSLSVIIPLFNEVEILERNLRVIVEFLDRHFSDYEVLIVESGSTDGSADLCDILAARMKSVRIIHEGGRNGIGSATRLGFQHAAKDLAWRYAIDLPCPLEAVLEALPLLSTHQCVLSYRASDDRGAYRKFQSLIYNQLTKMILGVKVRHVNSAFKIFHTDVIQKMPLRSNTSSIDAEMVFWTARQKLTWVEIPVRVTDRTGGRSSLTIGEPFAVIRDLVRFRRAGQAHAQLPLNG